MTAHNEELTAVFRAGELVGLLSQLDVDALERFLQKPQDDFRYAGMCHELVKCRRAIEAQMNKGAK